jgi:hypothetical protein
LFYTFLTAGPGTSLEDAMVESPEELLDGGRFFIRETLGKSLGEATG